MGCTLTKSFVCLFLCTRTLHIATTSGRPRLKSAGVILVLRSSPGCPVWDEDPRVDNDSAQGEDIIEATFVDDEGLVLMASSPKILDTHIEKMLSALVDVFRCFGLTINWGKGKTEAVIRYRGRRAAESLDRRRVNDKLCIPLPPASGGSVLNLVTWYRNLGTRFEISGSSCAKPFTDLLPP